MTQRRLRTFLRDRPYLTTWLITGAALVVLVILVVELVVFFGWGRGSKAPPPRASTAAPTTKIPQAAPAQTGFCWGIGG
jgi:hypothetical protein